MSSRFSSSLAKTLFVRTTLSLALLVLSGSLSISILHIVAPRDVGIVKTTATNQPKKQNASISPVYSVPQRIKIDSIAVDAPVIATGLTANNDMDISPDIAMTAWYKLGPKPGEVGSAVIAGHYGVKDGQRAIFSDLHNLAVGDTITASDDLGNANTFSVTEARTYNLDDDATHVFTSNDGKAHLNLITCGGDWNKALQTYSERFVVFTELVKS